MWLQCKTLHSSFNDGYIKIRGCLSSVGLGMYESPLFLPTHDEESGGRSVPTTPLQVAAPGEQLVEVRLWLFGWYCKWLLNETVLLLSFVWTVTVFTESHPSDVLETASQSVPMVSTSTGSLTTPGEAVPGDDGDDVFVAEAESEGWALMTVIRSLLNISVFSLELL